MNKQMKKWYIPFVVPLLALANLASASPCVCDKEVSVPFTWTVDGQIGIASAYVDNTGPMGTAESDTDSLFGNFKVSLNHEPPKGYCCCVRLDPLPTQITLVVTGLWAGALSNSTLGINVHGVLVTTYVRAGAVVSAPTGFPTFDSPIEIGPASSASINQSRNLSLLVGAESVVPFSGSVDVSTLFGFGSGTLGDWATGSSNLEVSGALSGPTTGSIRYLVPEPATLALLGLGLADMAAGRWRRRKSKA